MRKSVGSIRLDLAQYREMQVFSRFGGELDEQTVQRLKYGEGLMQLRGKRTKPANAALGAGCDAYMCTGANVFGCSRKKNQAGAEGSSDVFFRELQFALSQNRTRKKIQRRTAFRCCERCKGFFRRVFCMISPHLMQAAVDKLVRRAQACILF